MNRDWSPNRRPMALTMLALCCLVLLCACGGPSIQGTPIRVGSGPSPEEQLLGHLALIMLQEQGYPVVDRTDLRDGWAVRKALTTDSVDLCWAYTADTWITYLDHDVPIASAALLYQRVRDEDSLNGITWLSPTSYERSLGLLMAPARARELEVTTLSKLGAYVRGRDANLSLCTLPEWYNLPSGVRGLERVYNFQFRQDRVTLVQDADGYRLAQEGACDCVLGYAYESDLLEHDLLLLEDDRGFFMPTNLSLGVRTVTLSEYADLERHLLRLSGALDREAMVELGRQVLLEEQNPARVARRFLKQRKLIGTPLTPVPSAKPALTEDPSLNPTPLPTVANTAEAASN